MDLNEILIFTRVVQSGSFTAAARGLGMPKSTVSRKLSELEARIGARLLQRTTRKLSLTEVGRAYYERCARIIADAEEAELAVTRMQAAPRGRLRVTLPLSFGFLGTLVAEFCERHREVEVELLCTDRVVDLVEEGYDVAIRAGKLADSALMARNLGSMRRIIVASPRYVKQAGAVNSPQQLEGHPCLAFTAQGGVWGLRSGSKAAEVQVPVRLCANDYELVREAALAGLGVALIPERLCEDDLRAGRLQRLLPQWSSADVPIHAVYPSTRHLSPKVMAFLDLMSARLVASSRGSGASL